MPFSWLWLLVAGKGRQLLSVFNQIPFDIYPFLTPGLQQVPSCQFKLGYVSVTLWMPWMWQLSLVGILQGHLSFPVTDPELQTTALPWDHSHRLSPALPAGRGGMVFLWLPSDVRAGGWLPGQVSITQLLLKWNKNQHMQVKLPVSPDA